jgi:hypothetical protein
MSKEEETNTTSNIPLDSQTKQTVQKIPLLKTGSSNFLIPPKMQVSLIFKFFRSERSRLGKKIKRGICFFNCSKIKPNSY